MAKQTYFLGNVGDTVVYKIRDKSIEIISQLHSVAYENNKLRENNLNSSLKHVLTRAVGGDKEVQPFFTSGTINQNDTYLICSDGLYNHVSQKECLAIFHETEPKNNKEMMIACKQLTELAYEKGSMDNISIAAIKIL